MTEPLSPATGWGVLHLFCRAGRSPGGVDAEAVVTAVKAAQADGYQVVSFAVLGHKADLGFMALGPDLWRLRAMQTALQAAGLEVVTLPSPGPVERDGEIIPASYMNFLIGNAAVVLPLYGAANDEAAVAAVQALFPGRQAIGLRADHILTGGGSFHCISQQIPA